MKIQQQITTFSINPKLSKILTPNYRDLINKVKLFRSQFFLHF